MAALAAAAAAAAASALDCGCELLATDAAVAATVLGLLRRLDLDLDSLLPLLPAPPLRRRPFVLLEPPLRLRLVVLVLELALVLPLPLAPRLLPALCMACVDWRCRTPNSLQAVCYSPMVWRTTLVTAAVCGIFHWNVCGSAVAMRNGRHQPCL